jgi:hypothetical protein
MTFTGIIDEISVYNRALANEIQKIYAAGAAGKHHITPPGCVNPLRACRLVARRERYGADQISGATAEEA